MSTRNIDWQNIERVSSLPNLSKLEHEEILKKFTALDINSKIKTIWDVFVLYVKDAENQKCILASKLYDACAFSAQEREAFKDKFKDKGMWRDFVYAQIGLTALKKNFVDTDLDDEAVYWGNQLNILNENLVRKEPSS